MNKFESSRIADDQLLAKLGGRYILRIQAASQAISSFIGPPIGLYFILVTANLSLIQTIELIISLFFCIILVNIIIPIYIRMATRQARLHLDHIFKDRPLPESSDAVRAWKEILRLPGGAAIAIFVTSYLLVMLPIVLFMRQIGNVSWFQVIIIFIGGSIATMAILIQGILYMDTRLAAARRALLPSDPSQQDVRLGIGQGARQYFVTSILLLAAILTIGTLGYQKFITVTMPGVDSTTIIKQLQLQLGVVSVAIFLLGIFLASRLFQSISQPIQEMTHTIDEVHKGNLAKRAAIITSDETAHLTLRLNQLLDQLQAYRVEAEQNVQARTVELERKTTYFRAASQIAHEAAVVQDINTLLTLTADLISSRLGFYHTGVFLLDDSGTYAVLQTASSEGGQRMLARGHRLNVSQQSIVGASVRQNRPHIIMDVDADRNFLKNPDLPLTRSEAAIPLTARGKILGVLDIQSTEPNAFKQDDVDVLKTMADQIGLAIQNARSLAENQSAIQKLEVATTENVRRIWQERIRGANRAYRYTSIGITSIAEADHKPSSSNDDTNRMIIPVTLRGQRIGAITIYGNKETTWSKTDHSLAVEISNQVGLALENARLLDDAQRHAAQEQSLSELTARLSRSLDSDSILQTAVRELQKLPNVSEASVYITPPDQSSSDHEN